MAESEVLQARQKLITQILAIIPAISQQIGKLRLVTNGGLKLFGRRNLDRNDEFSDLNTPIGIEIE